MAARKVIGNQKYWNYYRKPIRKPIRKLIAFSLLECLVAISLLTVIMLIITEAFVLNYKVTQKTEIYLKYLNNSQYLYWLFNSQVSNNLGVDSITNININTNINNLINVITASSPKVEIISAQDFIVNYKPAASLRNRIKPGSNLLKINKIIVNNNIIKILNRVYFVAKKPSDATAYALYQYSNNYSDELVSGVTNMIIKEAIVNNNKYYIFSFEFEQNINTSMNNKINFVIKDSIINN